MKKSFLLVFMSLFFVFLISTNVFATDQTIRMIEIDELDFPYLYDKVDRTAKSARNGCVVKSVEWYKDGMKFYEDEFLVEGEYICRVYLTPKTGFSLTPTSVVISNANEFVMGQDSNGFFCDLTYEVKEEESKYPRYISFLEFTKPSNKKTLDREIVSNDPDFYDCLRIEWYKDGTLLQGNVKATTGEYVCRVYLKLYNGFEISSKNVAAIGGKKAQKITKDVTGIYFEVPFVVKEGADEGEVLFLNLDIKEKPSYGRALSSVNVRKTDKSEYYKIGDVEWYRDGYRMLDEYFYEGSYKCRIYIDFINGGYPGEGMQVFMKDDLNSKTTSLMGTRRYVEYTFNIKEYTVSTLKFNELNIPEYGAVQDTRIDSLEPGIYTPSMVYWYNEKGKYMSNLETFGEGKYTCKFTLTLNVNCKIKEKLKATINNETASAYIENNKITIEKVYEIKKPEKKWSKASEWAIPELENAIDYALIPNSINNQDFTQNITRAEFAAVAVRMYEALTLKTARPAEVNPFTDTKDSDVLKAYNLGITNGTSATTFDPKSLITRQEMATMMVRTLEKADISTNVNLNKVNKFADHNKIDSWALNGVYFMSNIGIIKGKGNNTFDVLGSATREEALAISIRSVNYYK